VSEAWTIIAVLAVVNATIKATGPVLAGRRELPAGLQRFVAASVPAIVAALIVTGTFGDGRALVLAERAAGLAAAIAAVALRAPMLVVLVVAAGTTALLRAVS
jgi:branched-subunit amino acid transport protein